MSGAQALDVVSSFPYFSSTRLTYCVSSCRHLLQQSPNEQLLTGLNLLRLLVHNRTAEFHVELELIPQAVRPRCGAGEYCY